MKSKLQSVKSETDRVGCLEIGWFDAEWPWWIVINAIIWIPVGMIPHTVILYNLHLINICRYNIRNCAQMIRKQPDGRACWLELEHINIINNGETWWWHIMAICHMAICHMTIEQLTLCEQFTQNIFFFCNQYSNIVRRKLSTAALTMSVIIKKYTFYENSINLLPIQV